MNDYMKTGEALQDELDKYEQTYKNFMEQEMISFLDMLHQNIGDTITYLAGSENKPLTWALKNYDDLEFCFEHNPSWHCGNTPGEWQKFDADRLQIESGCNGDGFDGIFIGTCQGLGEAHHEAENGEMAYTHDDGYFKILARIAQ